LGAHTHNPNLIGRHRTSYQPVARGPDRRNNGNSNNHRMHPIMYSLTRRLGAVLTIVSLAAVAGCADDGGGTGPGNFPDVRGDWRGQYVVTDCQLTDAVDPTFCTDIFYEGASLFLEVRLDQSDSIVGGTAFQGRVEGPVSGSVDMLGLLTLSGTLGAGTAATTTITGWETLLEGDSLQGAWSFGVVDNAGQGFGTASVEAELLLLGPDVLSFLGCPVEGSVQLIDSIGGDLEIGDCQLDDESYFDVYALEVTPADTVTITVFSEDYSPFLIVADSAEDPLIGVGDAGSNVASATGLGTINETWLIIASSFLRRETGAYSVINTDPNATGPAAAIARNSMPPTEKAAETPRDSLRRIFSRPLRVGK
jgi:hypothetical protein